MGKSITNFIFLVIFLIFISIPVFTSSLLDIEKENEIIYQKILQTRLAQKEIEKKYLMGKFEPSSKKNFVAIPAEYNAGGYKMYLRKETLDAFLKMQKMAEKDGIDLNIASATRNFDYQKNIWNNKWTGVTLVDEKNLSISISDELERFKKILEYSAVPGTSRHHWGTEVDINAATPQYFETKEGITVYAWLVKNAPLFGFCQPYNAGRTTGYQEEKWHWSYLPLAKIFTVEYKDLIKNENITGFLGEKYVPQLNLIDDYVLGINPKCL